MEFIIQVPGFALLLSPKLPGTVLENNDDKKYNCFSSDGISLTPLDPMKRWRLCYKGKMR